jgi:tetratricopeptide (TPR) repeat protein
MSFGALLICIAALAGGSAWAQASAPTWDSEPKLEAQLRKVQQAPPARQAKLLDRLGRATAARAAKVPQNVPTWQLLAWTSYQRQDYAAFIKAQHRLRELGQGRPSDYWAAAEWSFGLEDYVTTLEFVRYAEAVEGPSFRSASSRRNVFLRLFEGDSALHAAADYLAAAPSDPQAAMLYAQTLADLGANEEAYMAFRSAKKAFPSVTELSWQFVRWAAGTGRWEDALSESAAIWSDPSVAERAKVAYVSQLLNEDPREEGIAALAVRWTEGLLRQDSANPAFWALRGDVARWLDDAATADESWRRCIALPGGGQWPVYQQLLQLDLDRNEVAALVRDAEAAQKAHPEHPFGPLFYGVAQSRSADYTAAYATLTEGLTRFGDDPSVREQYLMYLGEVCHRLGRIEEFQAHFEGALAVHPDNPTCLNNYAYFLALRGRNLKEAAGMAERAVALAPGEINFWDTLAAVYAAQRNLPKAKEAIQKALDLGGTQSAAVVERAGDIYAALGAHDEAKRLYLQAQFLGNASSDLVRKLDQLPKP